tara:strand:- start:196 stop:795 length:600 start_codon:yes stop_codon:yes gene_type:complete
MSKKVKISIQGNEFLIPSESICKTKNPHLNEETYVYMRAKLCASIIKQYVKKNFPNLKVWAGSDVYSGGSSVRVEVCNQDGSQVNPIDFEKISNWKHILQGGTFNGMIDMYESREDSPTTDAGTPMKYFPSYVFIDNKPKWGTVEYWVNQYNEYKENISNPDWSEMVNIINNKFGGSFLEYNKTYMSKKEYDNCSKVLA